MAATLDGVPGWSVVTVGADGVILDRLDGAMPSPIVWSMLEELTA